MSDYKVRPLVSIPFGKDLKIRYGTAADFQTANPVLSKTELGYETDTHVAKIGDSKTSWINLPSLSGGDATAEALSAAVASQISDSNSAIGSAVAAKIGAITAPTKAATAPLLAKLKRGVQDASILLIGDSTGNEQTEHFYLEMVDLAARFPAYTVLYHLWDNATGTYSSAVTVQTGIGTQTLRAYNCSTSGKTPGYVLGSRWANAIAGITKPDLIFLSHSHNMGDPTPTTNGQVGNRAVFLSITEELGVQWPDSGLVLMSQNPTYITGRATWQAQKAQVLQEIAAQKGYGFIDVHQEFIDTGHPRDYVKVDDIHPTTSADVDKPNGSRLWADLVGEALTYSSDSANLPRGRSSLLQVAESLITNGDFSAWSGSVPDGYTSANATVTKDTANFETGTYGLKIEGGGASGASYVQIDGGPTSFSKQGRIAGRYVTAAARVYVPAGNASTPSLLILDSNGSAQQARVDIPGESDDSRGRFFWLIAVKKMTGNGLRVQIASRLSGTTSGSVTVDQLHVVEGTLPHSTVRDTQGVSGPAGSGSAGNADFLSTFGNNPGTLAIGVGVGATSVAFANDANLYRVRASRDMLISVLAWHCGTTGGNYDIGIYSLAGTKLWSKGSSVVPVAGPVTEAVSPGVAFTSGTEYWIAFALDGNVAQVRGVTVPSGSQSMLRLVTGVSSSVRVSTAFPLPNTLTPGTVDNGRIMGIVAREAV